MQIFENLLFSIGAMKAGTSWLYENLKYHPDIDTVPIKEIHYFWEKHGAFSLLTRPQRIDVAVYHLNRVLPDCAPHDVPALLAWFAQFLSEPIDDVWLANLFRARGRKRYCAEFSNMNSVLSPEGWNHARSLTKNIRIIYTIRNPLERMWSHARFQAAILGKFDELNSWGPEQFNSLLDEGGIVAHGAYSQVIRRLREGFSDDEYIICNYEDMRKEPLKTLRQIEEFLGLSPFDYPEGDLLFVHNETRKMTMPSEFVSTVKHHVNQELEELQRLNIDTPLDWAMERVNA